MGTIIDRLLSHAQSVADAMPDIFATKKNQSTNSCMRSLNHIVAEEFSHSFFEQRICGQTAFCVDFYVRPEKTVIEVELSAGSSGTNLERDIFKVLLAKDAGEDISTLIILGVPGTVKRQLEPGPRAILAWVKRHHNLEVSVREINSPKA